MLKGVNSHILSTDPNRVRKCQKIHHTLTAQKCFYRTKSNGHTIPWLISEKPWLLPDNLKSQLEQLGLAVFNFFDAIQNLYKDKHEQVVTTLDMGVDESLRGLQLYKFMQLFRLDIIVSKNRVYLTEIEEVFGGIGTLAAMEKAYLIKYDIFFEMIRRLNFNAVYIDDSFLEYETEVSLMAKRLKKELTILPFSRFCNKVKGNAWRFCYTKDFSQYPHQHVKAINSSSINFINPLFHGYASKLALTLLFDDESKNDIRTLMGDSLYHTLLRSIPMTIKLNKFNIEKYDLLNKRKSYVLKVADCRDNIDYNWGSRGVYFGSNVSHKRWQEIISSALKGQIPNTNIYNTTFMIMEQIDSDRYAVPFYNPHQRSIDLMDKARIKLGPIFSRIENKVEMGEAMEATFVNTSRKVHVGTHSVVAPVVTMKDDK